MAKKSMDDLLKRRMSAAQQASELEVGNVAYETMFQAKADTATPRFCELPINSLFPFRTADIGFHPYPPEKLRAFSQQLAEQGIYPQITPENLNQKETSVYKGYKQDKIEMRGDRAEMSDFPLYLNTVAGGLDRRDQTIGGFSFVVKIYAVPVVEIIG